MPLLVEAGSEHVIFGGFSSTCVFLQLNLMLIHHHVLCSFLALGCYFRMLPVVGVAAVVAAGSIASAAAAQKLREGFCREKSGLCAIGGREHQGNWARGRMCALSGPMQIGSNLGNG
jgi:hypothetical protein